MFRSLFSIIIASGFIFTDGFASDAKYLKVEIKDDCLSSLTPEETEQLRTTLFNAIENNDYNATKAALEAGAPPNTIKLASEPLTSITTRTPLHAAVEVGNPGIVDLLLASGAIIGLKIEGRTAFSHLAYQEHIDNIDRRLITESFIAHQPEQEYQEYIDEAFHHAVMAQNVIVAEAILEHAEISENIKNMFCSHFTLGGFFAYLCASFTRSSEAEKMLEQQEKYTWMFIQLAQRHSRRKNIQQNVVN